MENSNKSETSNVRIIGNRTAYIVCVGSYLILIALINFINVIFCIAWRPGFEWLKSKFYKIGTHEEDFFLDRVLYWNNKAHQLSLLILAIVIYLLLKGRGRKFLWLWLSGLATILLLFYQLYLFRNRSF
jgi:hypothetical protein